MPSRAEKACASYLFSQIKKTHRSVRCVLLNIDRSHTLTIAMQWPIAGHGHSIVRLVLVLVLVAVVTSPRARGTSPGAPSWLPAGSCGCRLPIGTNRGLRQQPRWGSLAVAGCPPGPTARPAAAAPGLPPAVAGCPPGPTARPAAAAPEAPAPAAEIGRPPAAPAAAPADARDVSSRAARPTNRCLHIGRRCARQCRGLEGWHCWSAPAMVAKDRELHLPPPALENCCRSCWKCVVSLAA